jgi:hypothetical protein
MRAKLVGRSRELTALDGLFDAVERGAGGVLLLAGPAGIGKSALAEAASSRAAERGYSVAWGRAWEGGGAPPFYPWLEVARSLRTRHEAFATVPEELLAETSTPALGPSADRFALFESVRAALEAAAKEAPLLVVLDDLHVADPGSLLLLAFSAPRLGTARVGVIGTFREAEARASSELSELIARASRAARTLRIEPLREEDVAALAPELDESARRELCRVSEGNPLYVVEWLHVLESGDSRLPDGIRAAIHAHLRLIDEAARAVLPVCATVGREFAASVVARATGRAPAEIIAALDGAVGAGIVVESRPSRYTFSHVLLRDVLLADLSAAERVRLHVAVARALEELHLDTPDAPLDAIAQHWLAAGPEHGARAIELSRRSARRACRRLAFEQAAELLENLLAVRTFEDARLRAEVSVELGEAQMSAGNPRAGRAACREAARLARELGDAGLLARAALTSGNFPAFGSIASDVIALLEDSLAALGSDDFVWRPRVLARLASAMQPWEDEPREPVHIALRAIELAREQADEAVLLETLVHAVGALVDFYDPAKRRLLDEEALRLARRCGAPALALRSQSRLIFDHIDLGDFLRAEHALEVYATMSAEFRQPHVKWLAPLVRSALHRLEGRVEESEAEIASARAVAARLDDANVERTLLVHRLGVERATSADSEVERRVDELGAVLTRWKDMESAFRAATHARAGNLDGVRAELARMDPEHAARSWDTARGIWLAEAAFAARDSEWAEVVRRLFADCHPDEWCTVSFPGVVIEGPISRALFLAEATLGRSEAARAHAEHAFAALRRARAHPLEARLRRETEAAFRVRATERAPVLTPPAVCFVQEAELWTVTAYGTRIHLKDSRGVSMLARLVAAPHDEVHVLELSGAAVVEEGLDAVDDKARDAYRRRVEELREDLAEATQLNDLGQVTHVRQELEAIEDELSRSVGIGGRPRRVGHAAERARSNVQRRITDAIAKIAEALPPLGEHLKKCVRTGTFCSYVPEREGRARTSKAEAT